MKGNYLTITMYSQPHCVQCGATARFLDRAEAEYQVIDTTEDSDAHAFVSQELGHMQAPVVVIKDGEKIVDHWSGFQPDKLKEHVIA